MEQKGVIIPQEIVEASNSKKRNHRTLRQMSIYRDAIELKYNIVNLYDLVPRKLTKFIDSILLTVSEAKKCIGLSHSVYDPSQRVEYLNMVRIFVEDVQDDIHILFRKGLIGKPVEDKIKKVARGIVAQAIALRDYNNGQGNYSLL